MNAKIIVPNGNILFLFHFLVGEETNSISIQLSPSETTYYNKPSFSPTNNQSFKGNQISLSIALVFPSASIIHQVDGTIYPIEKEVDSLALNAAPLAITSSSSPSLP